MNENIVFNSEDIPTEGLSILKREVITGFAPEKPKEEPCIIKVVGVGGGGGNAVTHMYEEGIHNVSFVLCNTDRQALDHCAVPFKVQLGKKGLGAGGIPQRAKEAAEESIEDLQKMLSDGTEMVFITAGMGGGTGTGAAPVIARLAREMDILTVGIVTIPFLLEGTRKIVLALKGIEEIEKSVDALLVIMNERVLDIYSGYSLDDALKKVDNILTVSARSIAEIITKWGPMNLDFADVNSTLREGGVAIISSGTGEGDSRLSLAIRNALDSPLLNNNDIYKAKRVLLNIYYSKEYPLMTDELKEIDAFMAKFTSDIELMKWGKAVDESLGERIKITILASGFNLDTISKMQKQTKEDEVQIEEAEKERLMEKYFPQDILEKLTRGKIVYPKPFVFTVENMDDNKTIEALLNHPAYNRSSHVMLEIAKKAELKTE